MCHKKSLIQSNQKFDTNKKNEKKKRKKEKLKETKRTHTMVEELDNNTL